MINYHDIKKIIPYFLMALYGCWLIWMLVNNMYLITSPYPIEYKEGHSLSSTCLMLKGTLPYTLETYPEYFNSYGIVYNLFMLPFVLAFGNSIVVYRLVNEFCIIAAILLLLFYRRRPKKWEYVLAIICNFYLFYHINTNVSARPDGLGMLLYISSIIIPIRDDYSKRALCVAALLSVLAFLTKPYYFMGWYLMSIVLIFKDWRKCIISNIAFHIFFLGVCILVYFLFPLYFYETIFAYGSEVGDMHYSIHQMLLALKRLSPILAVIIIVGLCNLLNKRKFLWHYTLISLVIVLLLIYPLGTNEGAYLTYHAQLLAPILFAFAIEMSDDIDKYALAVQLGVILCSVYAFIKVPMMRRVDNTQCWLKIEEYISGGKTIFNDPGIAAFMLLEGKQVMDDGVSDFAFLYSPNTISNFLFRADSLLLDKKNQYLNDIKTSFSEQKYDAAIMSTNKAVEFAEWTQSYESKDSVTITFPCNWPCTFYIYQRKID